MTYTRDLPVCAIYSFAYHHTTSADAGPNNSRLYDVTYIARVVATGRFAVYSLNGDGGGDGDGVQLLKICDPKYVAGRNLQQKFPQITLLCRV